jgi:hypothetical protein
MLILLSITRPFFSSVNQQLLSLVEPAPQAETDFATEYKCAFWEPGGLARVHRPSTSSQVQPRGGIALPATA